MRCPICAADHASCGGGALLRNTPIGENMRIADKNTKADLARYQDAQGHVFSVTAADAERFGYTAVNAPEPEEKAVAAPPANKARSSSANKSE